MFGNTHSTMQLNSTTSLVQYDNIVRQFYCWLQLLVQGLNFDKSRVIFINTLSAFAKSNQSLCESAKATFEKAASYIDLHLILRLEAYANE